MIDFCKLRFLLPFIIIFSLHAMGGKREAYLLVVDRDTKELITLRNITDTEPEKILALCHQHIIPLQKDNHESHEQIFSGDYGPLIGSHVGILFAALQSLFAEKPESNN